MAPKKRVALSIDQKIKVLNAIDKGQRSKSDIAKDFGIPKSTLFTILKNRNEIKSMKEVAAPGRIRARKAKYPDLEKALLEWIKMMRAKNVPIDGNILKSKADSFALRMHVQEFKSSEGWFHKFKMRHGISFRKTCGESASVNTQVTNEYKEKRLKELLSTYDPNDVFNADETGLFFKMLPDKTLAFKGETCSGGKRAKERITVLLAANMTGSEKLPPLIIGKYQKPRCFKGLKTMPTTYRANKKAWMTSKIYEEWIRDLDRKMSRKERNILLIVDNCTAHCHVDDLRAITIEFLPPNVTSVLQPLDQGVIQCFKKHYRRMLLNRIVICLESDKEYEIDILRAIYLCLSAWNGVNAKVISNCFKHAGFALEDRPTSTQYVSPPSQQPEVSEDRPSPEFLLRSSCPEEPTAEANSEDVFQDVRCRLNFAEDACLEDYIEVDANIECFKICSSEEEIIASITEIETDSSDEEEPTVIEPVVPLKDALQVLELVRGFIQTQPNSEEDMAAIIQLQNSLLKCAPPLKQRVVTDYFQK